MNNKGQTLVLFVALIPFIFILFVFAFDISKLYAEKSKLDGIAYSSLNSSLLGNKAISDIKNNIKENDTNIKINSISYDSVCLEKQIEPVFAGIMGKDNFKVKSYFKGKLINNKLVIEKKGK